IGTASASLITKYLGIDDLIFGILLGALNLIFTIATIEYLNKKNIKFLFRKPLIFLLYSLSFLFPFYYFNAVDTINKIFGIDKIIWGFILGNITLKLGYFTNDILIKKNNGKVYFKFQKAITPLLFLIVLSLILWFIGK
ncbi:MAG: hypothetical protein QW714_02460, partial [Nanopusillaceae archaeon]